MKNFLLAIILAVSGFVIDQASKYWVLEIADLDVVGAKSVLPVLNFVFARNTGVNFGWFADGSAWQQWVLIGFALAVSVALLIWAWRTGRGWIAASCGLIVGGALANAYDRAVHGAVIDFINPHCCGIVNPFAFNLADVWIFVGAGLLIFLTWDDGTASGSKSGVTDRP
ncbi:MAG: signal peptidase II [Neomegalonema sp.]|nr:signal peptidase II [Neomegalonema sp.]